MNTAGLTDVGALNERIAQTTKAMLAAREDFNKYIAAAKAGEVPFHGKDNAYTDIDDSQNKHAREYQELKKEIAGLKEELDTAKKAAKDAEGQGESSGGKGASNVQRVQSFLTPNRTRVIAMRPATADDSNLPVSSTSVEAEAVSNPVQFSIDLNAVEAGSVIEIPEALRDLYDLSFFPDNSKIYVRQEMVDAWGRLKKADLSDWNVVILSGSPGIGKSLSMFLHLCSEVIDKKGTMYHFRKASASVKDPSYNTYAISPCENASRTVSVMKIAHGGTLEGLCDGFVGDRTQYLVLVDGVKYHDATYDVVNGKCRPTWWCSSAHPNIKHESEPYRIRHGMSPWSIEDLEAAVDKLELGVDVDEHYYILGGVFRGIQKSSEEKMLTCSNQCERIDDVLVQLSCKVRSGQKDSVTHTWYLYENGTRSKSFCSIASKYFLKLLYDRLELKTLHEFLQVSKVLTRSVYGGVFQAYTEKLITEAVDKKSGREFNWDLKMADTDAEGKVPAGAEFTDRPIVVNEVMTVEESCKTPEDLGEELKNHDGGLNGVLVVPKHENFPFADWLILYNNTIYLINATVGREHSFKAEHYDPLVAAMTPSETSVEKVEVVYYLPDQKSCPGFQVTGNPFTTEEKVLRFGKSTHARVVPRVAYRLEQ